MEKPKNDLELLDQYCETCLDFINPFLFREVQNRGLVWVVNHLPGNKQEAKAVVRARLAKIGRSFGDEEIDQIANDIKRLEALRKNLNNMDMTDPHRTIPVLEEMLELSKWVKDYFKIKLPE